jgi:hypothetical protein
MLLDLQSIRMKRSGKQRRGGSSFSFVLLFS